MSGPRGWILTVDGKTPQIAEDVFIAPGAVIIGDVEIGSQASIWFGCVLRGDVNSIRVGARTNIQDGSIIHVDQRTYPCIIGDDVTIGHGAIVHGAIIGHGAMVAMRATVMNRATVGPEAIIGAGAIVTQGKEIPRRGMAIGIPAKVARDVTDDEADAVRANAARRTEALTHVSSFARRVRSQPSRLLACSRPLSASFAP